MPLKAVFGTLLWPTTRLMRSVVLFAGLCLLLFASFLILDRLYPFQFPDQDRQFATVVTDRHGVPLRAFADPDGVWRYSASLDEVSPLYIEALLAYEDRWFWQHPGVNPFALLRAMHQRLGEGRWTSGGSTLTMQVARQFHPHSKSLRGKLHQIFRALQLEWHRDKAEILTYYLNHAPFGGTIEGVQAASWGYLGKPASDLTHADAALLAVLPQSPSRLRPDLHPQRAEAARDKVLRRLRDQGVWSASTVADAQLETVISHALIQPMDAPLLARHLLQQLMTDNQPPALIRTTLDRDLQQQVQRLAADTIAALPEGSNAAVMIVDNDSAEVRAWLGTAAFADARRAGHVDMSRAVRSPGSTLKPFLYAMALDDGLIHSKSLLIDAPRRHGAYRPGNFNGGFSGPVSVTSALQRSLNTPVIDLFEQVGPARFDARLRSAGIALQYPGEQPSLAIILGGAGVSLEALVGGYRALATDGQVRPLVVTQQTNPDPQSTYLVSPGGAWIVNDILRQQPIDDLMTRAQRLSSRVQLGQWQQPLAWKTGTSYGHRDSWAIGSNDQWTLGIWVGRPDGTPMPGHYGANTAAPLMQQIAAILPGSTQPPRQAPASVSLRTICWPLGLAEELTDPAHCHDRHEAWVINRTTPATLRPAGPDQGMPNPYPFQRSSDRQQMVDAGCEVIDQHSDSVALWPLAVEPWLPRRLRRDSLLPPMDGRCRSHQPVVAHSLSIANLDDETIITVLDGQLPTVSIETSGGYGQVQWYLNGEPARSKHDVQTGQHRLQLSRWGVNEIAAVDAQGHTDRVEIVVRVRGLTGG